MTDTEFPKLRYVMAKFMHQLGCAMVPRYVVKHIWIFLCRFFWMTLSFKLVDFGHLKEIGLYDVGGSHPIS